MDTDTVFIGGIHGAGKTTFCRTLAPILGLQHLTASDLIREAGVLQIDRVVADMDVNQARLVAALQDRARNGHRILLDGHFCLITPSRSVARVPSSVFAQILPRRLLLIEADACQVEERLRRRGDTTTTDRKFIEEFAAAERQHAISVSSELDIPLKAINSATPIVEVRFFLE